MTADPAHKPTLTGELVELRPFRAEDLPDITAAIDDPEVIRLTGSAERPPFDPEALRRWYGSRGEQTDRLDLAVVDLASGRCVGETVLNAWDATNRSCSFRTLIGPAGRGRGLGTEAVRLTVGYAFEQLGLHRVSLEVYAFNPRARRVYEKVGFVAEGVLRQALRDGGDWADSTVMSVLSHEWARHRGRP
ncbi:GNAT family N-acetyltransferase [Kitasatospora sp. NPDC059571]|uniref:GNAT family N-acetyltransferase n=1 Tax=Kitasatospora sp. NPDC059571 TaxID=3346871 RepID=UPI003687B216